jgi:hypothetical protein
MTRTQTRTYGVLNPSTRQPLLEAMLRALAWLVSNVASFLGLTINRHTRDWHAGEVEDVQLPTPNDKQQETNPARRRNQTRCVSPLRLAAAQRYTSPSFAGGGLRASPIESSLAEGGGGVRRALARMTEGAVQHTCTPCHSRRSAIARRAGTQGRHAQASAHAAAGLRPTRSARVRNDIVCVSEISLI